MSCQQTRMFSTKICETCALYRLVLFGNVDEHIISATFVEEKKAYLIALSLQNIQGYLLTRMA